MRSSTTQGRWSLANDRHDLRTRGQNLGHIPGLVKVVRHELRYVVIVLDDKHSLRAVDRQRVGNRQVRARRYGGQ